LRSFAAKATVNAADFRLIEDAQGALGVAFGGLQLEARLGVELGESHGGPLFKEFIQGHAALLGQPLQALVFCVRKTNCHRCHNSPQ